MNDLLVGRAECVCLRMCVCVCLYTLGVTPVITPVLLLPDEARGQGQSQHKVTEEAVSPAHGSQDYFLLPLPVPKL